MQFLIDSKCFWIAKMIFGCSGLIELAKIDLKMTLIGIILDFIKDPNGIPKISVLTEDGVEWWYSCMVEVVDKRSNND